ncbi:hypothetical protein [Falsihalocynthiibacter arcticus]|uniref:hypothetical protein n=1 Tax=Falsihalocynthiibacter arcticus TaxID=1579316 RepID=UPI0015D06DAE|nr:hypothetical protein [Falsihalocynthiibacter arcticus]
MNALLLIINQAVNEYLLWGLAIDRQIQVWCVDITYIPRVRSLKRAARDPNAAAKGNRLIKGGSFMCHISYCFRIE